MWPSLYGADAHLWPMGHHSHAPLTMLFHVTWCRKEPDEVVGSGMAARRMGSSGRADEKDW